MTHREVDEVIFSLEKDLIMDSKGEWKVLVPLCKVRQAMEEIVRKQEKGNKEAKTEKV